MTPPSCATYQRERPRGGPFEPLSDLFGLSIYRWDEADYSRYRAVMLDCKRSLPDLRPELTFPQWEAAIDKTVTNLKRYTGFVGRMGEPMADQRGPRPRVGEPDATRAFEPLSCDRFERAGVNAWARGGAPDYGPAAPFGVPLADWTYEVWRAFENRVTGCVALPGGEAQTERDWLHTLVYGQEVNAAGPVRQARQDRVAGATKLAGILARLSEAEGLSTADEITAKLKAVEVSAAVGPKLGRGDEERIAAARDRVAVRLRAARTAEAEAYERDRPAREARARGQEEELTVLQRQNREREADAAGERAGVARIEAERQAGGRAQAERQAAEAEAQRQQLGAKRAAEAREREKADAAWLEDNRREQEAQLASDPCNKVAMRRQLMDAANTMDRGRFGGRKLLDLTQGRSSGAQGATSARSCTFVADWSSGQRGFVTITVRKNSFGDDLIEVRPF